MLPNLIIPGAQKSGTSSLFAYLEQHPDCAMSLDKEPMFFSKESNLDKLDEYKKYFPATTNAGRTPKIFGEATTGYMVEPEVPRRIRETLGPDMKFIFLLRNPVERTISAYWHLYKRFHEKRPINEVLNFDSEDLEEVLYQEETRIERAFQKGELRVERYRARYDDFMWPFYYVKNSLYFRWLSLYADYFSTENMLVLFLEELIEKPLKEFRKLEKFLGITEFEDVFIVERVYNKTFVPRKGAFPWLMRKAAKRRKVKKLIRRYPRFKSFYWNVTMGQKPEVDGELKKKLARIFVQENKKLADFLGKELEPIWE